MKHTEFATTSRGLNRESVPIRLWEKAKVLGVWNPAEFDYTQDKADWEGLGDVEKDFLILANSQFQAGEEAVTLDLLPLIRVIANEGRIEEEMFLTTFLFEEAKHVDMFSRFMREVIGQDSGLTPYEDDYSRILFHEKLPEALTALDTDPSPAAQVRASTTYNMVIEGMLAETGYEIFFRTLGSYDIMPQHREGIRLIKRDESRHIAYGVFLISRLIAADPSLEKVFNETMEELLPLGMGLISENFARYGDPAPFNQKADDFLDFAMGQYTKRMTRIQKSIGKSVEELYQVKDLFMETEEAVPA